MKLIVLNHFIFLITLSISFINCNTVSAQSAVQIKPAHLDSLSGNLQKYADFLDSLDTTEPISILEAALTMFDWFEDSPIQDKENAFRLFYELYLTVVQNSTWWVDTLDWNTGQYEAPAKYALCGIEFDWPEGCFQAGIDTDFLSIAATFLAENRWSGESQYGKWIQFYARLYKHPIAEDGWLCVSWEELGNIIKESEDFARLNSAVPEVVKWYSHAGVSFISWYLGGIDYSPLFDGNSSLIDENVKKSWENFISKNTNSVYHSLVSEAYSILEKNEFKQCDEYNNFISSKVWYTSYLYTLVDSVLNKNKTKP